MIALSEVWLVTGIRDPHVEPGRPPSNQRLFNARPLHLATNVRGGYELSLDPATMLISIGWPGAKCRRVHAALATELEYAADAEPAAPTGAAPTPEETAPATPKARRARAARA